MSIAYCGVTLLGAGLGPFLVGFLNERLFGGGATLGVCMAIVSVASATIATFLLQDLTLLSRAKALWPSPPRSLPPACDRVDR
jgi:hypothetical protein